MHLTKSPESHEPHHHVEEGFQNTAISNQELHDIEAAKNMTEDEKTLAKLGYKQEFKREFGLWSSFSVSFSLLGLLPSIASTLYYGLGYAGAAGMTWGWLIAMIGVQSVANSMAELCSSMPTSGGLYYSATVLAPPKWGPLAAWLTGWSNWLAQVTSAPSIDYGMASMVLAMRSMHDPDYSATNWQVFLLTVAIMIAQSIIGCMPTKFLAQFSSAGTILNTIAIIIVIILIPAANNRESPKFNSNHEAWGVITNQTEWPDGIAILMSFISIIWTMSGYDAPFHLAEECSNANIASPRAIVMTSGIGGIIGWGLQLVIAYTVVSIPAVMDDELGQPFVTYLSQCLSVKLVDFVTALTIISAFFMGLASMIAASRVCYAYSRDGCFPCSKIMATVNKRTKTPVNALWFNTIIGCLLLFLIFAGDVTIGAIFSVGAIASYVAFTIPIGIKTFISHGKFRPGPWNLGRYSRAMGLLSVSYVVLMIPILCFPQNRGADNTPDAMNWTVLVYFGPMLFALLWYLVYARKFFKGPKINIEHALYEEANIEYASSEKNQVIEGVDTHITQEADTAVTKTIS